MPRTVIIAMGCLLASILGCGDSQPTTSRPPKPSTSNNSSSNNQVDAAPSEEESPGNVSGVVTLVGSPPPPRKIQVTKDVEHCQSAAGEVPQVLLGDGGELAEVVVEISGVKEPQDGWLWEHPAEGYQIHQKGCCFNPRLLVVQPGGQLVIYNDDKVAHNINTGQWNFLQPAGAEPIKQVIRGGGLPLMRAGCNIHSWMEAWIYVPRSPYFAVTDEEGRFEIDGLPPGDYRATATHPALGKQRFRVTIASGKTAEQPVSFESSVKKD